MKFMPFGKYKQCRFSEIPRDYLEWLLTLDHLRKPLRLAVISEIERREEYAAVWKKLAEGIKAELKAKAEEKAKAEPRQKVVSMDSYRQRRHTATPRPQDKNPSRANELHRTI